MNLFKKELKKKRLEKKIKFQQTQDQIKLSRYNEMNNSKSKADSIRDMSLMLNCINRSESDLPMLSTSNRSKIHNNVVNKSKKIITDDLDVTSNIFLESYRWKQLRYDAIKKYGNSCQCCGASVKTGAVLNVDHIKPRKLFPQLALDIDNLQILCSECNQGKGNRDQTDWR